MNQSTGTMSVEKKLKNIFINRFGLDFDELQKASPEILDTNLLGKKLKLAPRDLLYIYFDVEAVFFIKIPESNVLSGFNTFNNILDCVNQALLNV